MKLKWDTKWRGLSWVLPEIEVKLSRASWRGKLQWSSFAMQSLVFTTFYQRQWISRCSLEKFSYAEHKGIPIWFLLWQWVTLCARLSPSSGLMLKNRHKVVLPLLASQGRCENNKVLELHQKSKRNLSGVTGIILDTSKQWAFSSQVIALYPGVLKASLLWQGALPTVHWLATCWISKSGFLAVVNYLLTWNT